MHTLFHIYGPIAIHSYGLMIAIGLLCFLYLSQRDPRYNVLHLEYHLNTILLVGITAAIMGGRLLFFITHPELYTDFASFFAFYEGGFSILGTVIAVLIALPAYLSYAKIPIIPFLDFIAIYAPVLQSISRIGCFFAGCCYGLPTTKSWGIIYTQATSEAPLYTCLHPTQLYSSIALLFIFTFQYFIGRYYLKKQGQLLYSYIFLIASERFIVDFWRGDRVADTWNISLNQYVALFLIAVALAGFFYSRSQKS